MGVLGLFGMPGHQEITEAEATVRHVWKGMSSSHYFYHHIKTFRNGRELTVQNQHVPCKQHFHFTHLNIEDTVCKLREGTPQSRIIL